MPGAVDLVTMVSERIAQAEMARRVPDWDGRAVVLPSDLPPLTLLAGRSFPPAVLARRLRFLRVMGWLGDHGPDTGPGPDPSLPPEATVEDHLAAVYGAPAVTAADHAFVGADPAAAALRRGLLGWGDGPPPGDVARLTAFFDQHADALDPRWRDRWPGDPSAVTAWARLEAATVHGDRFFGRRRGGRVWTAMSAAVWQMAERKRRRWG